MRVLLKIISGLLIIPLLLQSCASQNLFMKDSSSTNIGDEQFIPPSNHFIMPDDKISVSIWGHDDLSVGSVFGIYSSNEVYGKWVMINQNGEAILPKVGSVCLIGLTKEEAAEELKKIYAKFIVDPIIVVKILNREVTVLGEVNTPGIYLLEKDNNSLVEILGRAGGLSFYSNKRDVQLIRGGVEYELDLTKLEKLKSANVNLQSGDIINVPSRKGKVVDKKAPTLVPVTSVITALGLILSIIIQN